MARIRGRETGPELALRRMLWARGLRYRTHVPVPGKPDIAFVGDRLAVFVDGCFWHSCPEHGVRPKANNLFWSTKLTATTERDRRNELELVELGWVVLRFWEHEVNDWPEKCVRTVAAALKKRRQGTRKTRRRAKTVRREGRH